MANSDTQQFRNDSVSDLGGMSLATRQRGTLAALALAMFCMRLDFFALTLALPDMARSFAVTAQSAVLLIRHMLVGRGLMKPLSMAEDQAGGAAGAGRAGRRTRVG